MTPVVVLLGSLWSSALVGDPAGPPRAPAAAPAATTATAAAPDLLPEGAATARARYLEGDFAGAVAAADDVDAAFRAGPAFTVDGVAWMAWADARMTRALALRRLGRDADSDATLTGLAAVRPSYAPDRDFVPPKVVARFEELRASLLGGATVPLTLELVGGGALVLDGRGVPPGTVDVLPGSHFVGVAGGAPRGEVVTVDGPRALSLAGDAAGGPHAGPVLPGAAVDEGSPWVWVGVGAGAVGVAAIATVAAFVLLATSEDVANPGGITVSVDTSKLDR